jgi:CBS domain-containing protein
MGVTRTEVSIMSDRRTPPLDEFDDYKDEAYFDSRPGKSRPVFDARLLRESATVLPARKPLVFARHSSVTDATRSMQGEHRGAVLVTEDGTSATRVCGIFTERDVLFRIVDGGRNPAVLGLAEVMTEDPEVLRDDQTIAEALNLMSVGGFRHVPVVDAEGRPVFILSVRDVVQFLVEAFPREILNLGGNIHREREGG